MREGHADAYIRMIQSGGTMNMESISPMQEPPLSLGGGANNNNNAHQSPPAFQNLERMTTLPPLTHQASTIHDEHVKDAFLLMCSGDFFARWWEMNGDFFLHASSTPQVKDYDYLVAFQVPMATREIFASLGRKLFMTLDPETEQSNVLKNRVLHHFLRTKGASLSYDLVDLLCLGHLFPDYCCENKYQEALDIAMTAADIAIQSQQASRVDVIQALVRIAWTLKAVDRPLDAALVFQDIADTYPSSSNEPNCFYETCYRHCGDAFTSAGEYERAEEALLKALVANLHRRGNEWNVNDKDETYHLLESLVHVYYSWAAFVPVQQRQGLRIATVMYVLGGFFSVLDFQITPNQLTIYSLLKQNRQGLFYLKPKYRKVKAARRALQTAIRNGGGSPEHFRQGLLSCHDATVRLIFVPTTATPLEMAQQRREYHALSCNQHLRTMFLVAEGSRKEDREERLAIAQMCLRQRYATTKQEEQQLCCFNPACNVVGTKTDGTFMMCPCKRVFYCGKNCQRIHWKLHHQTVCTSRIKKNKTTKQQNK